ncbi:MAG: cupin domain-containing protein [bacterium]|nr:cupin domain-containing protein [bacterium]
MIVKNAAGRARFNESKMGKADLGRGDHLFAGLNAFEPGQQHEPHVHCDRDKLYVVLQGRGELTIGDEVSEVEPGDVALARAGVEHAVKNTGSERLVLLVAMAPPPPTR